MNHEERGDWTICLVQKKDESVQDASYEPQWKLAHIHD